MNVDVMNLDAGVAMQQRLNLMKQMNIVSEKVLLRGMSNGVGWMVQRILNACPTGCLEALRIWDHSHSGAQGVSGGGNSDIDWGGISLKNLEDLRPTLEKLRDRFTLNGLAELRGCSVAAGDAGEKLLMQLASIWDVPVQGGAVLQTSMQWTGQVVQADPDGSLSSQSGRKLQ